MCIFIIAIIPDDTNLPSLNAFCREYGLFFDPINNNSLKSKSKGHQIARATGSSCDCGTVLGSAIREGALTHTESQDEDEKEIEKRRKKGWSQSKIERWLSEKIKQSDMREVRKDHESKNKLELWQEFLTRAIGEGHLKWMGILLHFFEDTIEDENIKLKEAVPLALENALKEHLLTLKPDVLYVISAKNISRDKLPMSN